MKTSGVHSIYKKTNLRVSNKYQRSEINVEFNLHLCFLQYFIVIHTTVSKVG